MKYTCICYYVVYSTSDTASTLYYGQYIGRSVHTLYGDVLVLLVVLVWVYVVYTIKYTCIICYYICCSVYIYTASTLYYGQYIGSVHTVYGDVLVLLVVLVWVCTLCNKFVYVTM